jgi:hypothetical protein
MDRKAADGTMEGMRNRLGESMNQTPIPGYNRASHSKSRFIGTFLVLLIACSVAVLADDGSQQKSLTLNARVTHLLGFAGAHENAKGDLSIEGDVLRFEKTGKPTEQVKIGSIQDVFLGEQSKQMGGTPMTLGKAAVPFGGGRVVSLFAHKKYETLTLEYVDADGGFHGAIFELNKEEAVGFRNELIAKGAHVSNLDSGSTKETAGGSSESK